MRAYKLLLSIFAFVRYASGQDCTNDPLQVIELTAPDNSAKATFIPFGATPTSFWVKDRTGQLRDILLGFDNLTDYQTDHYGRAYFGPVVGRYANRIRNGTFTIPISKNAEGPEKFQILRNEHNGTNSLHGGDLGYDLREWSTLYRSNNSVTFALVDPDGSQGFPGAVVTTATYTLEPNATWHIYIHSIASKDTPIMLSAHHFWNLDAYQDSQDILSHFAQFNASRVIATDGNLIPTGELLNTTGTPLDFKISKSIGASINDTAEAAYCGTNCVGFDNCWILDNNNSTEPVFSLWSESSGIKMDIITNQPAIQIYSCNGVRSGNITISRKASQGGPEAVYENHSCVVIEAESWIDAINNPEFGVDQIYGPRRPYEWEATYIFSSI